MDTVENEIEEVWITASNVIDKIEKGMINVEHSKLERLKELVEGFNSYVETDTELKKGMIGLMYERHIYLTKLLLLEKLGVRNKWNHALLAEIRDVIYEESDEFGVVDFMATQE